MKINLDRNYQPKFQAKISPKFEKFMRDYINNGKNRIQNHYKLNKKIASYEKYGFDDYSINLTTKYISWGSEYSLVATKDGDDISKGIFLIKKNSFLRIGMNAVKSSPTSQETSPTPH